MLLYKYKKDIHQMKCQVIKLTTYYRKYSQFASCREAISKDKHIPFYCQRVARNSNSFNNIKIN